MNSGRFYIPGYMGMSNIPIASSMLRMGNSPMSSSMLRMTNSVPRGMGLFSRITSGIRSINWSGLLNNANKTLDVVNQTIPLVRQAGPMFSNMRSMLKIAKAFGSETTGKRNNNFGSSQITNNQNNNNNGIISDNYNNESSPQKKEGSDSNTPNFFV